MQQSLFSSPLDFREFLKDKMLQSEGVFAFQSHIYDYYHNNGRSFLWREEVDPYSIVVSEIMLQQTQTQRVIEKFVSFRQLFPTLEALAQASTKDVITAWQGLGYNRRGLALQKIAQIVVDEYDGNLPDSPETLQTFPQIGPNTAGSICAFAFNKPTVFIETNIRTVFIYSFFKDALSVSDKQIHSLVEQTLDAENPRDWYYALMDYGVMLKKSLPRDPNKNSKHYSKQSKFEGSERQIRGMILRLLTQNNEYSFDQLCNAIERPAERIQRNLNALVTEGFVKQNNDLFYL
jgi:A/G-specific adenine glycosylase